MRAGIRPGITPGVDINELIGYKIRRWWPEVASFKLWLSTDSACARGFIYLPMECSQATWMCTELTVTIARKKYATMES